jgi:TRAP-type uncharacterized transport system substrate-binding protein
MAGVQKPGTAHAATAPPVAPTTRTSLDRAVAAKGASDSLKQVRQQQAAFKAPPPSVATPPSQAAWVKNYQSSGSRPTTTVYYERRNVYYNTVGWRTPVYATYGAPYYGVWDGLFLWAMLDRHHDWAYHHYDDPAYRAWRRDADRLAQDNAELRAKLEKLDQNMKTTQGPRDPTYIPEGVKPEVALAANVVTGVEKPKPIRFATGTEGSFYASICAGDHGLKAVAGDMEISCENTAGSRDNVMGFLSGRFEAIVASTDVIDWALRAKAKSTGRATFGGNQLTAYNEVMMLLVNKDSGVKNVAGLKAGFTLYVGPTGSGTEASYQNLATHAKSGWIFSSANDQYQRVTTKNASYMEGVRAVANQKNAAMLVMMPARSAFVSNVDQEFGDRVKLVPLSGDSSLAKVTDRDGNYVYHECTLDGSYYPKLVGNSVQTLCVQAVVVVSAQWAKESGQAAEDLFLTAWEFVRPELDKANAGVQ